MQSIKKISRSGAIASVGGTSTPPCDACGSREVNADGRCVYCATARTPVASLVEEESSHLDSQQTSDLARRRAQDQLLAEIKFLTEQYCDTGHPGIPVKISNARLQLEKLTGTDNNG